MAREIKFRAWDKKRKQMNYAVFVGLGKVFSMTKTFKPNLEIDADVMQYTGFNDVNGNEIYVGDIILSSGITEIIDDIRTLPILKMRKCKVIGNIYGNKEQN